MSGKEAKAFTNAIGRAVKRMIENKEETARLGFPFSGMYVSLKHDEKHPSDLRKLSEYYQSEEVINEDRFFLVIESFMGGKDFSEETDEEF